MKTPQHKAFPAEVRLSKDDARTVIADISTSAVDRSGEVLVPDGCRSKSYEANPIVCLMHDSYFSLPVGKITALKRTETSVQAKIVFAERPDAHPAEEEWTPDTLFSLYQQGVLSAFSVGFLPLEGRAANTRDQSKYGEECRYVHAKWDLLEVSVVPIPCNQEAVATAVSKGLITQAKADKLFAVKATEGDPSTKRVTELLGKVVDILTTDTVKAADGDDVAADEAKSEDVPTASCVECGQTFPVADMVDDGEGYECADCRKDDADAADDTVADDDGGGDKSKADERIEVIDSFTLEVNAKDASLCEVHVWTLGGGIDEDAIIERTVNTAMSKARGVIYID
jgi:HK97 family phage prohead protease